jgi:hypothetical protein
MNMSIDEATWHQPEHSAIIINAGNEGMEAKASQHTSALRMFIRGSIAIACIIAISLLAALLCILELCARFYKQAKCWCQRIG